MKEFFNSGENRDMTLFVPTFVLLRGPQENAARERNIAIIRIPDYYFSSELKEAGEL